MKSKGFSPFRDPLGYYFTKVETGYSRCALKVNEKLLNAGGNLHGGATFSMADSGMGAALYYSITDDEAYATSEIRIVYIKPVTSGALICDSKVIHKGKQIAFLESEIMTTTSW
jgi:acyl-CoA thioesterase